MFSQKYGSKPIQFISINSFGKIVLHAEAVTFLKTLAAPISLAAILGPSQTGKSFIMQQIVSQGGQFNEGATSGIWVWSKPMLAYNQQGRIASILLVDSQGFGLQRKKNDQTLIGLILLLANCLLYNSIGPIDSVSFSELQEVMTIARQLKDRSCDFHWILRDFDPTLVDSLGAGITGKQYMENQLMTADSFAQTTVQSLRQSFPSRNCHCFVKPAPSATEQPPQFLKQVIQLRKCLNGVPSVNLEGSAFVSVVQAFIDSLNAGDSLLKASEQGRDCRMRLQCLQRLGQELRSLQQRQSCKQIEDFQQQLGDIRTQLKQYYKQRMCSHRQIQILDQQLNEIIQDFQELNEPSRTAVPSRQVIRLNVPKPDRMVRLSFNISQSDKDRMDFDSRARLDSLVHLPLTSIGRINTDKNLHSKMEEYQAKIYRYELEASCSRKELQGLKDEYDQSRRELDFKTDQLEQLIQRTAIKEKEYQTKIERLEEELQEIKKAKLMVESQLTKIKVLNQEKVSYLQEQLNDLEQQRQQQLRLKQQKYRVKLAQCLKENQDLKKSHEEELAHLKKLYQQSHEQLVDIKQQQSTENFYKEMRQQMQQLQSLKEQLERQRFSSAIKEENIATLKKQLQYKQQAIKQALQQASKRAKDAQRHLKEMFQTKLGVKEQIIQDLQQRIKDMTSNIQSRLEQLINQNNRLLAELQQKDRKLTLFTNASEENSRQIGKLKETKQDYEQTIQVLNQKVTRKDQQRMDLQQQNEELINSHQQLISKIEMKDIQLQQIKFEVAELKGEVSILQQTHQIEVSHLKQQYQTQISQLKQLFQAQKQRLQVRLKEVQNSAQMGRRIRQDYQDLQHQSAQTEFQLRQMLEQKDRQLDSTKACLRQSTQQCEQLTRKNNELLASLMKVREQTIANCEQAAESQKIMRDELQSTINRINQTNNQKQRLIATLKQQLQREQKTNALRIEAYQKENEQLQFKLKNQQNQFSKQNLKLKEELQTLQKKQIDLSQQVALLTHKLSLQQQSLVYKSDSKNIQITRLAQKVKTLQSKFVQANTLSNNYQQQLKQEQQQVTRLQRLLSAFFKEKEVFLSNLQDLQYRNRMNQRKYQAHLNLFQEKLQQKKQESNDLRQRLEQYREDYENLFQIKTILQRNLQKESLLWQNKLQLALQRRNDFK